MNINIIKHKKGFTLSELMVSVFITMILMGGLIALWVSSNELTLHGLAESSLKNAMSNAMLNIRRDLMSANAVVVFPSVEHWTGGGPNSGEPEFSAYTPMQAGNVFPVLATIRATTTDSNGMVKDVLFYNSDRTGIYNSGGQPVSASMVLYCLIVSPREDSYSLVRNTIDNFDLHENPGGDNTFQQVFIETASLTSTLRNYCGGSGGDRVTLINRITGTPVFFPRTFSSTLSGYDRVYIYLTSRVVRGDRVFGATANEQMHTNALVIINYLFAPALNPFL